jgi:hypothetical protein
MEGALHRDEDGNPTQEHARAAEQRADPQQRFAAPDVCDGERPKGEALTTAGAQNVTVGAERERKSLA